jgi:uncharacterized protein
MRTFTLCCAFLQFAAGSSTCFGQVPVNVHEGNAQPFVFGETRSLNSSILHQERTFNIYLPDGYRDTTATYPVIYVLDGSANEDFPHIAGLAQFMNMYDLLPKSIVVGIANVGPSRYHDFTHVSQSDSDKVWIPTGGGSAAFIDFLEREALPLIAANYRTNGTNTIIGQSLGGLLAAEILFKRPALFANYVIVSPSFWWDNGSLAGKAEEWVRVHATSPMSVFLAMAKDDDMMQPQMDQVVAAFKAHAQAPLRWWYVPFPEESHATILHRAVYKGFELINAPVK